MWQKSICLAILLGTMLALLLLSACAPTLRIQTPTPAVEASSEPLASEYTFSGSITRDQSFIHQLAPTLTLQLLPYQQGWEIWLGDPTYSQKAVDNFAMPVTFPFAPNNARYIEGWHFRNSDNSGPNQAGEKNVNAPQETRHFCYVTNQNDFQSALASLAEGVPALSRAITNGEIPTRSGTLTITDYTLGNLLPEQKAHFEEIVFTITLNLDRPCEPF